MEPGWDRRAGVDGGERRVLCLAGDGGSPMAMQTDLKLAPAHSNIFFPSLARPTGLCFAEGVWLMAEEHVDLIFYCSQP